MISLLYLSLHRLETLANSQTNLSTTRTRQRTTRFTVPALTRQLDSLPLFIEHRPLLPQLEH